MKISAKELAMLLKNPIKIYDDYDNKHVICIRSSNDILNITVDDIQYDDYFEFDIAITRNFGFASSDDGSFGFLIKFDNENYIEMDISGLRLQSNINLICGDGDGLYFIDDDYFN